MNVAPDAETRPPAAADELDPFTAVTRTWFATAFARPTAAQAAAWSAIARGEHTLVVAPTGSGKTLAAFLWSLDQILSRSDAARPGCGVVYISPLKALAVDIERNLATPLLGLQHTAARLGVSLPPVRVAVRTGDTPAAQRRAFARSPAEILITTPESLFLLLSSAAREALRGVRTVIVDEIHAVTASKRGAHLAVSLERLDALLPRPAQRIGLSATARPLPEIATFLGGAAPVTVVAPPIPKSIELRVEVAVADLADPLSGQPGNDATGTPAAAGPSVWPAIEERLVDLISAHRSTIVFANSRRLAERLCGRINEIAAARSAEGSPPQSVPARELARAHHGSVSREQRSLVEQALQRGELAAVVATSSLELGIDMGAVDLVVQVEAPPSVAAGLQRIGRAGHQVGAISHGVVLPKYRGDLVVAAVVAERMARGEIEALHYPRNPLDVLAQHIVSMCAMEDWSVGELAVLLRRAAPFAGLGDGLLETVLDMLSGRYPSAELGDLTPRLVWDRTTGTLHGRPGAQRLAVTSGGTIPDRGLFGVFLVGERVSRVGELDEEMVYESRVGDVILLGSSSWRIEEITHDRVLVSPAPGRPGKLPFWHGDSPGRPAELGSAVGEFLRAAARDPDAVRGRCVAAGLDGWARENLLRYLDDQQQATGRLPDDRTVVVERFRDELGDWRLAAHSVFGARVNAPWALAVAARLRQRTGMDAQVMHSDDGIVLRLPDSDQPPGAEVFAIEPEEIAQLVRDEVGASTLFASRFRECAARSLLLPRRDPRRRAPLWQQRQRSAQLLAAVAGYPDFPVVLETLRECLQDVYDLPALVELLRGVAQRDIALVEVQTPAPSPFARSLLFGYLGAFIYEGDAPLAERRAQALSLDPRLLAELLGSEELLELLSPEATAEVSVEVGLRRSDRQPRGPEDVADLLRRLGDLSDRELAERGAEPEWAPQLLTAGRVLSVRVGAEQRWIVVEDAGRYRDALATVMPPGVAQTFLDSGSDPLADLVARWARTHGPFTAAALAERWQLGRAVLSQALTRLAARGRVSRGELLAGAGETQWCDAEVLRAIHRRSLARLRREIEPVPPAVLARFLPGWHGVGERTRGPDAVSAVVEQLAGTALAASALETLVLPARVPGYQSADLDALTSSGEVAWIGGGALPGGDGWLNLYPVGLVELLRAPAEPAAVATPVHQALLDTLSGGGALFFRDLARRSGSVTEPTLVAALWDLVWGGWVSNDTLAPLRALLAAGPPRRSTVPPVTPLRRPRSRYPRPTAMAMATRSGLASTVGRWSATAEPAADPVARQEALAAVLLDRHGVLTRGAVVAERVPGGFTGIYPVLRAFEESGRARRGYFIDGLGGAQFGVPGAVERLRAHAVPAAARSATPGEGASDAPAAVLLAASDPANPYGASLPWPERTVGGGDSVAAAHRPSRAAGAAVVLLDGEPLLYLERGGRSVLSFTSNPTALAAAAQALRDAARRGVLGRLLVERVDGVAAVTSPAGRALQDAGFAATPRGLRWRR